MNTPTLLSPEQQQDLDRVIQSEGNIAALRYMRAITGCDLDTAKAYVGARCPKPAKVNSWPAALLILMCGIIVVTCMLSGGGSSPPKKTYDPTANSDYDGSVPVVKSYLRQHLKDPDSYQGIEWSSVRPLDNGKLAVRHKYRAKNSFGGYVIEEKVFVFDKAGKVYATEDFPSR